ncbi:MAG TPA: hypothetical protein VHF51_05155 [Solirubrobacteraceae bacterium]|nr:hypothetical protein [Solirubrobacteraceae bacterium]
MGFTIYDFESAERARSRRELPRVIGRRRGMLWVAWTARARVAGHDRGAELFGVQASAYAG